MNEHLFTPDRSKTVQMEITPESAGWTYLSFAIVGLKPGERHDHLLAGQETAVVPISGSVALITVPKYTEPAPMPATCSACPAACSTAIGKKRISTDQVITGARRSPSSHAGTAMPMPVASCTHEMIHG